MGQTFGWLTRAAARHRQVAAEWLAEHAKDDPVEYRNRTWLRSFPLRSLIIMFTPSSLMAT